MNSHYQINQHQNGFIYSTSGYYGWPANPEHHAANGFQAGNVGTTQQISSVPKLDDINEKIEFKSFVAEGPKKTKKSKIGFKSAIIQSKPSKKEENPAKLNEPAFHVQKDSDDNKYNEKTEDQKSKPNPTLRSAGGEVWQDPSLAEWDPHDYRLFIGDLSKDAQDTHLEQVFSRFPSFQKAKVVKDYRTGKSKGYGFVSLKSADDYLKASREMNGKYVCGRPIKIKKSKWKDRNVTKTKAKKIIKEYGWMTGQRDV